MISLILNGSYPNKPLQLTAGSCGFNNVCGVASAFGLSDGFRRIPAATEFGSLALRAIIYGAKPLREQSDRKVAADGLRPEENVFRVSYIVIINTQHAIRNTHYAFRN